MASVPCTHAVYHSRVEITRLSGLTAGEFRGLHVGLSDGASAVNTDGVLLARWDDEVARFEQRRERRHSRRQVVRMRRGLRPSLRGALVLVATVATEMVGMMAVATGEVVATATREVAFQRRVIIQCRQSEGVRGRQRWR